MGRFGSDGAKRLARWMLAYSEVMAIAALMVVPPGLGLAIDRQLATTPWGVVLGASLGVGLGIFRLVSWSEAVARSAPRGRRLGVTPPDGMGVNASPEGGGFPLVNRAGSASGPSASVPGSEGEKPIPGDSGRE